jgi:hypothetical protein
LCCGLKIWVQFLNTALQALAEGVGLGLFVVFRLLLDFEGTLIVLFYWVFVSVATDLAKWVKSQG